MVTNKVVKLKGKWYVKSEDNSKNLGGPYDTEPEARKRLKQVEYFKHTANVLQTITLNLQPKVEHRKMEGREYLVVPMVMLTEGVHAGSNGPLYYSPEELGKTPVIWNHKPIVVYHPTMGGQAISACDPDVFDKQKVGVIMGAVFEKGKLRAEAWLEEDRVRTVDNRVLDAINAGTPMEISTGLFTDNDEEEGEWQGEKYTTVARNFRPDHLAILPDMKGACSLADGAGLLRNQAEGSSALGLAQSMMARASELIRNELSQNDLIQRLSQLLPKGDQTKGGPVNSSFSYVADVYDTFFVYSTGDKLYRQGYVRDGEQITLTGNPQEVTRTTTYKTLDGNVINVSSKRKGIEMDKQKFIDALIQNEQSAWEEDDRKWLMEMDEDKLKKLEPVVVNQTTSPKDLTSAEQAKWDEMDEAGRVAWLGKRKAPPTKNDDVPPPPPVVETPPLTVEEYIENAPPEMRDMLTAGLAAHHAEKAKLVGTITANKANQFTSKQLDGKSLVELQNIAALARTTPSKTPTVNYGGQGDGVSPTANKEEPLTAPATFEEKK